MGGEQRPFHRDASADMAQDVVSFRGRRHRMRVLKDHNWHAPTFHVQSSRLVAIDTFGDVAFCFARLSKTMCRPRLVAGPHAQDLSSSCATVCLPPRNLCHMPVLGRAYCEVSSALRKLKRTARSGRAQVSLAERCLGCVVAVIRRATPIARMV